MGAKSRSASVNVEGRIIGAYRSQPKAISVARIRLAIAKARIPLKRAYERVVILCGKRNVGHSSITLRSNFTNLVNLGPRLFVASQLCNEGFHASYIRRSLFEVNCRTIVVVSSYLVIE